MMEQQPIVWVMGEGGLIGSAVVDELQRYGATTFLAGPANWSDATDAWMLAALAAYAEAVRETPRPWAVVWAAGKAVPASSAAECARETERITRFASALVGHGLPAAVGRLVFVSSAGGIYAGAASPVVDESTPVSPTSAYGREKLAQELLFERAALALGVDWYAARVTNAYGPGQDLSKPQGLISKLCQSSVTGAPTLVTVGLDTQRDFVHTRDAGRAIADLAAGNRLCSSGPILVASGQPTSLGAIVGLLRRIRPGRPTRIRVSPPTRAVTDGHFTFRSRAHDADRYRSVSMADGIASTLTAVEAWCVSGGDSTSDGD